jgi:hypothetical protein
LQWSISTGSKPGTSEHKILKFDLTSWNPSEAVASVTEGGCEEIEPFFHARFEDTVAVDRKATTSNSLIVRSDPI